MKLPRWLSEIFDRKSTLSKEQPITPTDTATSATFSISTEDIRKAFAGYDSEQLELTKGIAITLIKNATTPDEFVKALQDSQRIATQLQNIHTLGTRVPTS